MDIDPKRLREFLKIVETGTFTEAAKVLNVSQPALSNSIKVLEQSVGVKLLTRDKSGAKVTEFGEMLADSAVALEAILSNASQKIEGRKAGSTGSLTIGVSPIAASYLVPGAIAELLQQSPSIFVRIFEGTPEVLIEKLRNMELDLIVGSVGAGRTQEGIEDTILFSDPFCVISRPGSTVANQESVNLKKLQDAHWVMAERGDASQFQMNLLFQNAGLAMPRNIISTNSIIAVKNLVASSDCISLVPPHIVIHEKRAGILQTTALRNAKLSVTTGVRAIEGRELSPIAKRFVEALRTK